MHKNKNNARLGEMNPKVDYAFKLIFGNKEYPEITKSLLNSIISLPDGQKIVDVTIANPNIDRRYKDDKYSIMDIFAVTNNNILINIEMQMINRDDMIPRTLHYMSRIIAGQLKSGKNYGSLKQTICINFVDFDLFNGNKYAHNEFSYRTARGDLLTNLSQIHFIELPKAEKGGIIENEMLQKWVKFINNPSSEEVKMFSSEYLEIGEAKKILSISNLTSKIRDMYYAREDARREKASWEEHKKNFVKNLLEKGKKEIFEEGIAEGSHAAKLETAANLKKMGMPHNKISEATGLSLSEIQELE
ncbi:MAG: Rpn family recombination-promoting nuclease/putative transposase [Spirochaetales bacterium]|nr:Rpn family recombination-promoting nuclease/putative transposase [Spirochaetales bacterium]